MTWYAWLIVGYIVGIAFTAVAIVVSSWIVLHNPKLQARFMRVTMRGMMKGSANGHKANTNTGSNVGSSLLAVLPHCRKRAIPRP